MAVAKVGRIVVVQMLCTRVRKDVGLVQRLKGGVPEFGS